MVTNREYAGGKEYASGSRPALDAIVANAVYKKRKRIAEIDSALAWAVGQRGCARGCNL